MSARIAVLISGEGRNLQALIEACAAQRIDGEIVLVLSNRAQARGLLRAQQAGIATATLAHRDYASREDFDAAMLRVLAEARPDFVVLAGFMRILTPAFIRAYAGRLLNIHPSLLPRHPGLNTHQAVIDAGETEHGATVHFVTEELDGGPRIIQGQFKRRIEDDAEALAERVMQEVELKIYPQAVAWMARGELTMAEDGRVSLRGKMLGEPLSLTDLETEFR